MNQTCEILQSHSVNCQRGAVLFEVAAVGMVLVTLLSTLVTFGTYFEESAAVIQAVQMGGRAASKYYNPDSIPIENLNFRSPGVMNDLQSIASEAAQAYLSSAGYDPSNYDISVTSQTQVFRQAAWCSKREMVEVKIDKRGSSQALFGLFRPVSVSVDFLVESTIQGAIDGDGSVNCNEEPNTIPGNIVDKEI